MVPKQPRSLPADWESYWTDFLMLKGRSLSPQTLRNYHDTLILLGRFLAPSPPRLANLTRHQLAAFIDHCAATSSATTTGMRFRGLSAYFGWLVKPGPDDEPFLESNPLRGLRPPKDHEKPVPVLSQDDVRRLIAASRGQQFEDRRDEALIRFMHDTGCRRGEVASMKATPEWLSLKDGTAMVSGKSGPRVVAFDSSVAASLHRYLRLRRNVAKHDQDALWLARSGKPLLGNGIYQLLKRRFELAGVTATKLAHVFRHTFAHQWKSAGGSVDDLMSLAGWTSPEMARRYGKSASMERAHEAHRRLSPGRKL